MKRAALPRSDDVDHDDESESCGFSKSSRSSEGEEKAKRGARPRKRRAKKEKGMPRRPLSAYNFFFRDERLNLLQQKKSGDQSSAELHFNDLGKIIGARWKQLSTEERQRFVDLAEQDLERYQLEMKSYNKTFVEDERLLRIAQDTKQPVAAPSVARSAVTNTSEIFHDDRLKSPNFIQSQYLDRLAELQWQLNQSQTINNYSSTQSIDTHSFLNTADSMHSPLRNAAHRPTHLPQHFTHPPFHQQSPRLFDFTRSAFSQMHHGIGHRSVSSQWSSGAVQQQNLATSSLQNSYPSPSLSTQALASVVSSYGPDIFGSSSVSGEYKDQEHPAHNIPQRANVPFTAASSTFPPTHTSASEPTDTSIDPAQVYAGATHQQVTGLFSSPPPYAELDRFSGSLALQLIQNPSLPLDMLPIRNVPPAAHYARVRAPKGAVANQQQPPLLPQQLQQPDPLQQQTHLPNAQQQLQLMEEQRQTQKTSPQRDTKAGQSKSDDCQ